MFSCSECSLTSLLSIAILALSSLLPNCLLFFGVLLKNEFGILAIVE
jgi:hypothetical protein